MQSYREEAGSRPPVSQLDPLPAPVGRDDLSTYRARYEEAMNPFEAFRGRVSEITDICQFEFVSSAIERIRRNSFVQYPTSDSRVLAFDVRDSVAWLFRFDTVVIHSQNKASLLATSIDSASHPLDCLHHPQEATRAYHNLNPVERGVFLLTRSILGNRRARVFFVCYALFLHMLVMYTTYECTTSSGKHLQKSPRPYGT